MSVSPLNDAYRFKNGYTVQRLIGRGGFSLVYLVRDDLGNFLAVKECCNSSYVYRARDNSGRLEFRSDVRDAKVVHPHLCDQAISEAKVFSSNEFRHAHLLPILGFFEENNTVYLKMPYLQGQTLNELHHSLQGEETAWKLELMEKVASAVGHLHKKGFIHRDLKPENIMVLDHGRHPLVLDTGASRKYSDTSADMTRIVTPFCAPEITSPGNEFGTRGPASDCFALAGIFYWLLTSKSPPSWSAREQARVSGQSDPLVKPHAVHEAVWGVLRPTLSLKVARRESDPIQLVASLRDAFERVERNSTYIPPCDDLGAGVTGPGILDLDADSQVRADVYSKSMKLEWMRAILLNVLLLIAAFIFSSLMIPQDMLVLGMTAVVAAQGCLCISAIKRIGLTPKSITPWKNIK